MCYRRYQRVNYERWLTRRSIGPVTTLWKSDSAYLIVVAVKISSVRDDRPGPSHLALPLHSKALGKQQEALQSLGTRSTPTRRPSPPLRLIFHSVRFPFATSAPSNSQRSDWRRFHGVQLSRTNQSRRLHCPSGSDWMTAEESEGKNRPLSKIQVKRCCALLRIICETVPSQRQLWTESATPNAFVRVFVRTRF